LDTIIQSRWKSFALRFAVFFPIFFASRLLFGAGFLRFLIACALTHWIDPVRRAKAKTKANGPAELEEVFR
jgi:hypothetical protein